MTTIFQAFPLTPTRTAVRDALGESTGQLLIRRVRTEVWLGLFATVLWAVDDLAMHGASGAPRYWAALIQALVVLAVGVAVAAPKLRQHVRAIALAGGVGMCLMIGVSGVLGNSTGDTALRLVIVCFATAALHPWGVAAQSAMIVAAGVVALANGYVVNGSLPAALRPHNLDFGLALGVSLYVAYEVERYRRESERRNLGSRLHGFALEATANGVLITERDGRIIWANQAFADLTGYSSAEVLGRNPRFLKSGRQDEGFYRNMWQTILSGRAWRGELVNRRKDGSLYFEEMTITPVRAGDGGEVANFIAIKQDVSERKWMEVTLQESEERFRSAFDNAPIGMALVVPDGTFLRVNRALCQISGYTEKELLATTVQAVTHPEDLALEVERVGHVLAGEVGSYSMEKRCLHKRGHAVWLLVNASLIRGVDGRPLHFVSELQDISERKAREQERADFIAMLTHDIRNPVNVIQGYAEILEDAARSRLSEEDRGMLHGIRYSALCIGQLAANFLLAARIEAGKIELRREPVDLDALADQATSAYRGLATSRNVGLQIAAAAQPCRVEADKAEVERVIGNLLHNAIKYSPAGQTVLVEVRRGKRSAIVRVTDRGPGIAPRDQRKLFQRYGRLNGERGVEGAGLGLYIVRTIVEAHGGTVEIDSALGRGTTFIVRLPYAAPNSSETN